MRVRVFLAVALALLIAPTQWDVAVAYPGTTINYLVFLAVQGAKKRFGEPLPDEIRKRLDYELEIIVETAGEDTEQTDVLELIDSALQQGWLRKG